MAITGKNYTYEKVSGSYIPAKYPGERSEKWSIPDSVRSEYGKLNNIIETKYSREYLKVCAFYNKLFPSLRTSGYITSSYNVPAFTAMDQERTDTGTGMASNYLKQIIDQVVSRIGTITFEPALLADVPTLEYIIYKDEVERLLRKTVREDHLTQTCMEVFHDAAIIGYSHVFIDPITHKLIKANDYEVGMFESQYTQGDVKQMLYRNYSFPVTSLVPYLINCDEAIQEEIIKETDGKDHVDFKLYFDCPGKRCIVTIGGKSLPDIHYPFDKVQMVTFGWDIGFSKVTSTSLFDLLYPTQREVNKVVAKIQQLIRMYKGAVPVFNSDVDLAMKAISNGSGEALYVDSSRPIDTLMTVINPTPIDSQLSATKVELKTEMYELAGLQQISFNMENMRSAAAVIAVDQTRDTVFQAQLSGISRFIAEIFRIQVHYNSVMNRDGFEWADVDELLKEAQIELKPVSITSPLGTKATAEETEPDYIQIATARTVNKIIKGKLDYTTIPYNINKRAALAMCAIMSIKLVALDIEVPATIHQFLIAGYIDDLKQGYISL